MASPWTDSIPSTQVPYNIVELYIVIDNLICTISIVIMETQLQRDGMDGKQNETGRNSKKMKNNRKKEDAERNRHPSTLLHSHAIIHLIPRSHPTPTQP